MVPCSQGSHSCTTRTGNTAYSERDKQQEKKTQRATGVQRWGTPPNPVCQKEGTPRVKPYRIKRWKVLEGNKTSTLTWQHSVSEVPSSKLEVVDNVVARVTITGLEGHMNNPGLSPAGCTGNVLSRRVTWLDMLFVQKLWWQCGKWTGCRGRMR